MPRSIALAVLPIVVPELIEAGAVSFKIEGRLKDASYVKNVVAAYSQRLDNIIAKHPEKYCRASKGHCTYTFTPNLKKTFNRGFTTYFLHGRQPDIFSPDTPKAMGEFVGTVKEMRRDSFNVAGTAAFANGDGLCFINQEHDLEGFRVNRAEGNRLFPQQMPRNLRPGMALYRNNDMEFERLLARQSSVRKIPITMMLAPTPDGYSLASEGVTATIQCEHQQAEKPQRDNIIRQLSKLGGTPYECSGVEMPSDFNAFIPSSLLADLRRQLLAALNQQNHGDRFLIEFGSNSYQTTCPRDSARDSRPDLPDSVPHYDYPYLYNISNHATNGFRAKHPLSLEGAGGGSSLDAMPPLPAVCHGLLRQAWRSETYLQVSTLPALGRWSSLPLGVRLQTLSDECLCGVGECYISCSVCCS